MKTALPPVQHETVEQWGYRVAMKTGHTFNRFNEGKQIRIFVNNGKYFDWYPHTGTIVFENESTMGQYYYLEHVLHFIRELEK